MIKESHLYNQNMSKIISVVIIPHLVQIAIGKGKKNARFYRNNQRKRELESRQ